jgi:hypothetical protein
MPPKKLRSEGQTGLNPHPKQHGVKTCGECFRWFAFPNSNYDLGTREGRKGQASALRYAVKSCDHAAADSDDDDDGAGDDDDIDDDEGDDDDVLVCMVTPLNGPASPPGLASWPCSHARTCPLCFQATATCALMGHLLVWLAI